MGEELKEDFVKEPLWYLHLRSKITKRNDRVLFGYILLFTLFVVFFYLISFTIFLYIQPPYSLILGFGVFIIIMALVSLIIRKYVIEWGMNLDRFVKSHFTEV